VNDADGSDATVDRADIVLATTCFAAIRQKTSANLPQLKRSLADAKICHTILLTITINVPASASSVSKILWLTTDSVWLSADAEA